MNLPAEQMNIADPTSGMDVDALLASIDGDRQGEIPMTSSEEGTQIETDTPAPAAEQKPAEQTQAPATQEIEFTWNGKQIKAPITDPRLKQWASQGYDYNQKMAEFNQRQAEIQKQAEWAKQAEDRYKAIDEYVQKNPQFWDHVTQTWTQAQSQNPLADPNNPVTQKLQATESKLSQIEQFIESQRQAQEAALQQQEDQRLNQEIKSIQEKYPDLDLTQVDESGKTLETRVLEFAIENGIKKFSTAFNAFNHDRLLKLAEEKGKEAAQRELQKKTKLGLLGTSPTPTRGFSQPKNIKEQSYESLYEEALQEAAAMRGA
jgi:hypothetical protein